MKLLRGCFYVYEHWRPDKDVCFYVGKGKGGRAYVVKGRKGYHGNIVKKLHRLGMFAEVRLVQDGLSEAAAFALEIERIAFWKSVGIKLANRTKGGDGAFGRRFSKETLLRMQNRVFTEEHRARISNAKQGIPKSETHKKKLSQALLGRKLSEEHKEAIRKNARGWPKGKKRGHLHNEEARAKISAGNKGRAPWCKGKTLSLETRQKMSAVRLGKKRGPMSEEQKIKLSAHFRGRPNTALKGKPLSAEHRQKLVEAWERRRLRDMEVAND